MPNRYKLLILGVFALAFVTGAAALGQYLGGMTFANMQTSAVVRQYFHIARLLAGVRRRGAVKQSLVICTTMSVVVPVLPVVMLVLLAIKSKGKFAQFGDARFATRREIRAAGLLED